jgi:beta-glucanase (GH16 family)
MGMHVFHSPTAKPEASTGDDWRAPWDLADDYHIFGLDWNEKTVDYFVDGVLVRRVDNAAWHQALTLNFDSETMPGWFGMPDAKELPSTYRIDYSRVWRKPAMEPALPGFE